VCHEAVADGKGCLAVEWADLEAHFEAQRSERAESLAQLDLDPAPWRVLHHRCDPAPKAPAYTIRVERLRTAGALIAMTAHMLETKTWLPATNWADVLHAQAAALSAPAQRPQVPEASEPCRAIFDCRLHVAAASREALYEAVNEWLRRAREVAPEGVDPRYTTLRSGSRSRTFRPTIEPDNGRSRQSGRAA
jgi:hypothetical protein